MLYVTCWSKFTFRTIRRMDDLTLSAGNIVVPISADMIIKTSFSLFFTCMFNKNDSEETRIAKDCERELLERKSNTQNGVDENGGSYNDNGVVRASSIRELYLNVVRFAWRSQATRVSCPPSPPSLPPIVSSETVLRTDREDLPYAVRNRCRHRLLASTPSTTSQRCIVTVAVINRTDGKWARDYHRSPRKPVS